MIAKNKKPVAFQVKNPRGFNWLKPNNTIHNNTEHGFGLGLKPNPTQNHDVLVMLTDKQVFSSCYFFFERNSRPSLSEFARRSSTALINTLSTSFQHLSRTARGGVENYAL